MSLRIQLVNCSVTGFGFATTLSNWDSTNWCGEVVPKQARRTVVGLATPFLHPVCSYDRYTWVFCALLPNVSMRSKICLKLYALYLCMFSQAASICTIKNPSEHCRSDKNQQNGHAKRRHIFSSKPAVQRCSQRTGMHKFVSNDIVCLLEYGRIILILCKCKSPVKTIILSPEHKTGKSVVTFVQPS